MLARRVTQVVVAKYPMLPVSIQLVLKRRLENFEPGAFRSVRKLQGYRKPQIAAIVQRHWIV
ncbi:MAG: hypothetical protein HYY46_23120 [Deltaproteobacteria bacterium]|nr:hypothetical protein [Deltaproteobacteria bacterium]